MAVRRRAAPPRPWDIAGFRSFEVEGRPGWYSMEICPHGIMVDLTDGETTWHNCQWICSPDAGLMSFVGWKGAPHDHKGRPSVTFTAWTIGSAYRQ